MTHSKPFIMSVLFAAMFALLASVTPMAQAKTEAKKEKADKKDTPAVLNFTVQDIHGKDVNLADYQGKVVLMVNVASKCGFTPQYEGLEKLYKQYQDQGFVILGFPANNFGHQEPGTNLEIAQFCKSKYGVTFPMFGKISVKGDDQAPLYQYLTDEKTDPKFHGEVKWNFEKFLISKDGQIVERFRSKVTPESDEMIKAVEKELAAK